MPLLTTDEYRTLTGLSEAQAPDARYDALCEAAGIAVEGFCKRRFERETITEYHTGKNTRFITLRRRPVVSITSVSYDRDGNFGVPTDSFDSTCLLEAGADYALDSRDTGLLIRVNGTWNELPVRFGSEYLSVDRAPNWGEIEVVYVGGYDPIPADLRLAVAQVVTQSARLVTVGGNLVEERLGDWSYKLDPRAVLAMPELGSVRQILARYREIPW